VISTAMMSSSVAETGMATSCWNTWRGPDSCSPTSYGSTVISSMS
jgi:hypothetical protein